MDDDEIKRQMRELSRCLEGGMYFESVKILENLLPRFNSNLLYKTKLSSAIACHRHMENLNTYQANFNSDEISRGLAVHVQKIGELLGGIGLALENGAAGHLFIVCQIIRAHLLVLRGETRHAIGVLLTINDAYAMYMATKLNLLIGQKKEARNSYERYRFDKSSIFPYVRMDWEILKQALYYGEVHERGIRLKSKPWANSSNKTIRTVVEDQILNWSGGPQKAIHRNAQIVTIGSCFAINLAYSLKNEGMAAEAFMFGENVNNTYTNRIFFDKIIAYQESKVDEKFMNFSVSEMYNLVRTADVLIYTAGTSIGFFDGRDSPVIPKSDSGTINAVFFKQNSARKISVQENLINFRYICNAIKTLNPKMKIIITVSPVPLGRSFGVDSAVIGDCVSKSTLRVAIDELLDEDLEDVFYWPSFEIAKWLLPHYDIMGSHDLAFGADDDFSRHPAGSMVDLIVESFLAYAVKDQ